MKIQLLIASAEKDYSEHLSKVLSAKHADTFVVASCTSQASLSDAVSARKYDVILIEPQWEGFLDAQSARLVLVLWNEHEQVPEFTSGLGRVYKYQRISTLVSDILSHYASVASGLGGVGGEGAGEVVAVWSPAGGVGKTSVALAYATRCVSNGKTATYLDLEHFSGTDAYFSGDGRSISLLFEKLHSNTEILIKSVRQHDSGSGIDYFNPPNNYDDINELTVEDVTVLTSACARSCDVVVVDLPSMCDKRTKAVLELADKVLIVTDGSKTCSAKLNIFLLQNNVFGDIKHKSELVANKGAKIQDERFEVVVKLPMVQSADPISVYKTLSGSMT
ncbi:MAG: hypothetical protein FWB75_07660 [Oscillospiraceae bacterium]|nr:hypothetical protein [Oscillospiraceae bacterium]